MIGFAGCLIGYEKELCGNFRRRYAEESDDLRKFLNLIKLHPWSFPNIPSFTSRIFVLYDMFDLFLSFVDRLTN